MRLLFLQHSLSIMETPKTVLFATKFSLPYTNSKILIFSLT
uniref:Alternative protein UCHL3 n=1 Tax=Homo sapiens TaxID=9606 RepID=L8E899_HUMAN|nr:alternative protein UCHL3 [Homo sapiens]